MNTALVVLQIALEEKEDVLVLALWALVEYLVQLCALQRLNFALKRDWHNEKSTAFELEVLVQLPERYDRELF